MENSVQSLHWVASDLSTEMATVLEVGSDCILVQTPSGVEQARRAVACIVQPEVADVVMLVRSVHKAYVLAVLERQTADDTALHTTLSFNGPVSLTSPNRVSVTSDTTQLVSREFSMTGEKATIVAGQLSASGEDVSVHGQRIRVLSRVVDVVADRVSRQVKHLISRVRGQEVRQSDNLTQQVVHTHLQQSRHSIVEASKDLRLNAERIHMG